MQSRKWGRVREQSLLYPKYRLPWKFQFFSFPSFEARISYDLCFHCRHICPHEPGDGDGKHVAVHGEKDCTLFHVCWHARWLSSLMVWKTTIKSCCLPASPPTTWNFTLVGMKFGRLSRIWRQRACSTRNVSSPTPSLVCTSIFFLLGVTPL